MIGYEEKRALDAEAKIVWLKDINLYPWVRQKFLTSESSQGMPLSPLQELESDETIVGYAELKENTPPLIYGGWADLKQVRNLTDLDPNLVTGPKHYRRRIFTLRENDYKNYKNGDFPMEAVVTSTITTKNEGIKPQ